MRNGNMHHEIPRAPKGKRAFVVGDVHGCADLLELALQQIEDQINSSRTRENHIVFLGDLIDRGPQSRQVVERLIDYSPGNAKVHFIAGNHEDALVTGVNGRPSVLVKWLEHGGYQTMNSYGVTEAELRGRSKAVIAHLVLSHIPQAHIKFFTDFLESIRFGDYLFVHAGVRPEIALVDQTAHDMRWIRQEFLTSNEDFGAVVVHGHTVTDEVEERHNRIGIDTGAYKTGRLTILRLEGDAREIITIKQSDINA